MKECQGRWHHAQELRAQALETDQAELCIPEPGHTDLHFLDVQAQTIETTQKRGGNVGLGSENPVALLALLLPGYVVLKKSPNLMGPTLNPCELSQMDFDSRSLSSLKV